jgi:ankyrin repeat protein
MFKATRSIALTAVLAALGSTGCDRRDEHGMTALMRAAHQGDTTEVRAQIGSGRGIDDQVKPHNPVRALLAFIAWMQDLPDRNPGWTALMFAVDGSHDDAVRMLVKAGANVSIDAAGITPLQLATFKRDVPMMHILLDNGALVGGRGYAAGPVELALALDDTVLLRRLIGHGASLSATGRTAMTPLMMAAEQGSPAAVRILMQAGADPNVTDRNGWRASRYALAQGHDEIAAQLGTSAPPSEIPTQRLFTAIGRSDRAAFSTALREGADPNALNEHGRSVLMEAAGALPEAALLELIDAGARIQDREAGPLLFVSVVRGHHTIFERLIAAGQKPPDSYVADAVRADQLRMVKRLLELGLDPNAHDATGRSAIELARLKKRSDMIAILETAGASRSTSSR